jgi:VanZ family protein
MERCDLSKRQWGHLIAIGTLAIYAAMLTFLLLIPNPTQFVPGITIKDILAHFLTFTFLGMLFSLSGYAATRRFPWMIASFYAIIVELLQHFVPNRSVQLLDACMNVSGLLTGILLIAAFRNLRPRVWRKKAEADSGA